MRTAKELFRKTVYFDDYQKLISTAAFEPACHAALSTLLESFPESTADPSKSWDAHCQMVGARRVLDILNRLHEPDQPFKEVRPPELNYQQLKQK